MIHTIHNFWELKALCNKRVIGRYDSPELVLANQAEVEYDDEAANQGASCDSLGLEPSNGEAEASPPEPIISAPAAAGIDGTATTEAEVADLSDSNLSPADFAKLAEHGVRPKDAIEAGLCHISSSEAAFRLDRVDTGALSGILTPYRLDGGISHCRIMFNEPVTLAGKNKGRVVSILQPTRSTNHLYVPQATEELLANPKVPVIICSDEWSTLSAGQICEHGGGALPMIAVGHGGTWGWRMSMPVEDRDGETRVQKGPVIGLKEKVALEGRRIIIAYGSDADNDAGVTAARTALTKLLRKQRAIVSTLEVPSRADGRRQDFGQWIAADGAGVVGKAVRTLLDSPAPESTGRGYLVNDEGIYWVDPKTGPFFLSSPFRVMSATREIGSTNWGRDLEVRTPDGSIHEVIIPMSELADGGTVLAGVLLVLGVRVNPNRFAKERLALWVQMQMPQNIFVTSRVGWHEGSFVLPERTIAPPDSPAVKYYGPRGSAHRYHQKGTLSEWKDNIGRLCIGNSRLTLASSLAFVGALLKIVEQEPGGFHYRGASSTGKTTALAVAGSVWGGGPKGFTQTWRATSNGLEAVAEMANDTFLCLDEIGQVSPDETGRVAYMLAIGQGKVRMTKDIRVRAPMLWSVVFLSTGEISLADHMMSAGHQVRAGQEARLIDVPADAGKGMGIFENIHDSSSPDQFANRLTSAASSYYGTASIAFLEMLVSDRDRVANAAKGFVAKFLDAHVNPKAAGEIFRAARRFGLVAFAGECASDMGITGWPEGEATKAAVTCFKAWLERRGSLGAGDTEAAIAQIRLFLTLNGTSRFETICVDDASKVEKTFTRDRVGFREEIPEECVDSAGEVGAEEDSENMLFVYYVLPVAFRTEVCKGFDPDSALKALRERGHLDANEKGRMTYQKRLPGIGKQRLYRIRSSIFAE
jgi:putative DNA primase/helicase